MLATQAVDFTAREAMRDRDRALRKDGSAGGGSEPNTSAEQRAAAFVEMSGMLIAATDERAALREAVRIMGSRLGWSCGNVWLVDAADGVLRHEAAWRGTGAAEAEFIEQSMAHVFRRGEGLPGRTWTSEAPAWIMDVQADPNFTRQDAARRAGLRAGFAFPIHGPHGVVGVIEFFSPMIRSPDRPLLDAIEALGGQIGRFLEHRWAEAGVRAAHTVHRAILEAALDCIISMDDHGRITEFNPAAEATFGYRRDDVIGREMADVIIPPSLRDAHRRGLARYLASGETRVIGRRIEINGLRADGAEIPVELTITRLPLVGPPRFTGFVRDLTVRKREEEARRLLLQASEILGSSLEYERTTTQVVDLVVPAIADWCAIDLVAGGDTLQRVAMKHRDPARGEQVRALLRRYPPRRDAPRGAWHVITTGVPEFGDVTSELLREVAHDAEHLRAIEALSPTTYVIAPLTARGRTLGAFTMATTGDSGRRLGDAERSVAVDLARRAAMAIDNAMLHRGSIETQRLLEEQAGELEEQAAALAAAKENLEVRHRELAEATAAAEAARESAEEANRAKSVFLATMSHELRTPLNAIAGYGQLIADGVHGPVTSAQREALERIHRSQEHLAALVGDILDYATLETGNLSLQLEDIVLDDAIADVHPLLRPDAQAKELTYELACGAGAARVRADRDRLRQIVLNLVTNAIKFTPAGGRVTVATGADATHGRVRVIDTGIGIPAERQREIFDPFVQLDAKLSRQSGGVGLGLAISSDLARAMKGELTVASVPGKGSTFTLALPRT